MTLMFSLLLKFLYAPFHSSTVRISLGSDYTSLLRLHRAVAIVPATLHSLAVDAWRASGNEATLGSLLLALVVDVFEVECVAVPSVRTSGRRRTWQTTHMWPGM